MNRPNLQQQDHIINSLISAEEKRQSHGLELIASENYVSEAIMEAMGTVLNNRYSEGYPGRRYYGGQEVMDEIENLAIQRANSLFGSAHANVQPHAGAPANIATYLALAQPGDGILGMELSHGGHLTHGSPVTHTAKLFQFSRYRMSNVDTGEIDYDEMRKIALERRPKIVLAGYSAYPRELDYARIREIASEVGAYAVADVAHIAGLIAAGAMANPFDYGFDVVLSTTHKTLRGPRGGMILSRTPELGRLIDKSVFPGFQGGPIMQMVAAKAVAFHEAAQPDFRNYANQVLSNAKEMATAFSELGVRMVTNGTSNHLLLVDCVTSWGRTGNEVQELLDSVGITLNKNVIADDPRTPLDPSGVRIGTPALTTRGMKESEMRLIAVIIDRICREGRQAAVELSEEIVALSKRFPVPGISA